MLKKISFVCLMFSLLALTACGSDSPAEITEKFITAQYRGNAEESYRYLCKADKDRISLENYQKSQQELSDPMLKDFFANAKIAVKESSENGDTATVTAEQEISDIGKVLQAGFKTAFNQQLKTDEERQKALLEELGGKIPAVTITVKYTLLKEDGEWKIKKPNPLNILQ